MATDDNEEELLRSVALQNANSILLARQRAERELIATKEALERKTEELAHSLAMMRATLESSTDGILVTDANGQVTGFNQNFVDLWRVPPEIMNERKHRGLLELTSCRFAEPEKFRARIEEIYRDSPPKSFDLLALIDGTVIERHSKIQFVDERNVGRVWSFRDITERTRAEEELRQQREWYQITLASIGDAVMTADSAGRVTSLNSVAESLTGWKTDEAAGRPLAEVFRIINEETRQPVENPIEKVLAEGNVVGLANHTVLIAKDGTEHPIDDSGAPIRDAEGRILGAVLVFRDISGRRQVERQVQESEERHRILFTSSPHATFVFDAETLRFLAANEAALKLYGYSEEEFLALGLFDIRAAEDVPLAQEIVAHLPQAGHFTDVRKQPGAAELHRHRRKDGRVLFVEPSFQHILLTGRSAWLTTIADITERKQAEDKLRESEERVRLLNNDLESRVAERTRELRRTIVEREALQEQLLQAQKMESVGTLAGGIAHDFNNILNIIQGYAFIARAHDVESKEAAESLTVIIETIQRGSALVQQLLTLARKSEVKTESTDANTIVEASIKLVSQTFPKTIELRPDLEPNLPPIMSDGNQLGQALLNLCVNARDAMPGGGSLTVKTQAVDGASLPRELAEANAPRYVCIEISDTGIGMAEDVRTRIFEPFFTTKKVGRGTGLGLAVVYGIVTNHNGFIDVQSKPMCGTTFRLYLPAAPVGEKPAPEVTTETVVPTIDATGSGRILVVEDESNMVSLLRKVLLRQGYQVVEASDGQTALEVYKREKDNIDAVLLDIGLPKKGGEDLLLQMKEHNPDVKVIVASGYIEPELKANMKRIGIEHFIDKPYLPDEIIQALQNLLHDNVETH